MEICKIVVKKGSVFKMDNKDLLKESTDKDLSLKYIYKPESDYTNRKHKTKAE